MLDECVHDSSSLMARFDPRLKIVGMGLFSVLVAVMDKKEGLVFACVLTLAMVFLSGLSLWDTVKRLFPVNSMVVFLWVFLPFSVKGQAVWGFGPFTASREGLDIAVLITLKANVMMLMCIAFAATTEVMKAAKALACLGLPSKLVHLLFFTYRYVFVIEREFNTLRTAMAVRGFVPGNSIHTYRSYAYLVGMLLVRSWDRAERVYKAMICRGFNGSFYSLSDFAMNRKDGAIFGVICLWMLVMGWLEWMAKAF
jgi:cobalt/nickel transport system permease protein